VRRRLTPIVLTGPPGSGRSTELRRAAHLLSSRSHGRVVHVNWFDDPAEIEPGPFLFKLARYFFEEWGADVDRVHPNPALVEDMRASDPYLAQGSGRTLPPQIIAGIVFEAYAKAYKLDRFALFLDGLDQAPPDRARMVLHKLLEVAHKVDLVVVVGPELTNGTASFEVLDKYRLFPLQSVRTDSGSDGLRWLRNIALHRVGESKLPSRKVGRLISTAAELSGGLPRRFLALLADAAKYSDRPDPGVRQLTPAADDQALSLRQSLVDGDRAVLNAADGTNGLEVPEDRKTRLLNQGMLLEYPDGKDVKVHPHPLLRRYLD